jgi:hypothetical protein
MVFTFASDILCQAIMPLNGILFLRIFPFIKERTLMISGDQCNSHFIMGFKTSDNDHLLINSIITNAAVADTTIT